jgi:PqqD family protein of HPr-rel-A system
MSRSPEFPDTAEKRYVAADKVSWTDAGGDLTLFDRDSGTYHALNASGSAIWRVAVQDVPMREIAEQLAVRFAVDPVALRDDIATFLLDMVARGLMVEGG